MLNSRTNQTKAGVALCNSWSLHDKRLLGHSCERVKRCRWNCSLKRIACCDPNFLTFAVSNFDAMKWACCNRVRQKRDKMSLQLIVLCTEVVTLIHRWPLRVYVLFPCFRITYISHYDAVMYSLPRTCRGAGGSHAKHMSCTACITRNVERLHSLAIKLHQLPHDRSISDFFTKYTCINKWLHVQFVKRAILSKTMIKEHCLYYIGCKCTKFGCKLKSEWSLS